MHFYIYYYCHSKPCHRIALCERNWIEMFISCVALFFSWEHSNYHHHHLNIFVHFDLIQNSSWNDWMKHFIYFYGNWLLLEYKPRMNLVLAAKDGRNNKIGSLLLLVHAIFSYSFIPSFFRPSFLKLIAQFL
jgi:hypothetical protein